MKSSKEMAIYLVNKFSEKAADFDQDTDWHYDQECALIVVEEILYVLKYPPNFNRQVVHINTLHYWQEVKTQIEKL